MPEDLKQVRLEPELEEARVLLNELAERGITLGQAIDEAKVNIKAAELKLAQYESLRGLKSEVPLPRKVWKDKGQPRAKNGNVAEPNPPETEAPQ